MALFCICSQEIGISIKTHMMTSCRSYSSAVYVTKNSPLTCACRAIYHAVGRQYKPGHKLLSILSPYYAREYLVHICSTLPPSPDQINSGLNRQRIFKFRVESHVAFVAAPTAVF
ncbi:hypothetical protein IF1G_02998 [Cordyceps javanica]|uniref:Uncharacterized protein n=1 Tax=Cordyceps javanica TaxID=43265 RepID=A0A545VB42_9HYPO|nr:hypothetical protein IF1G_02998 [Cordyceps javanica]